MLQTMPNEIAMKSSTPLCSAACCSSKCYERVRYEGRWSEGWGRGREGGHKGARGRTEEKAQASQGGLRGLPGCNKVLGYLVTPCTKVSGCSCLSF